MCGHYLTILWEFPDSVHLQNIIIVANNYPRPFIAVKLEETFLEIGLYQFGCGGRWVMIGF